MVKIYGHEKTIFFDNITYYSFRYNEVRANVDIDCCIILVGNKSDQRHIRAVSIDDARRYADDKNIQ